MHASSSSSENPAARTPALGFRRALANGWRHFLTITRHKALVMRHCFRVGLYKQGLLHDLSKYSPSEFMTGVRFYTGTHSPNAESRRQTGISRAWLHHKGRNKHHFEYWIDMSLDGDHRLVGFRMPYRYVAEMFCDRLAASKVYRGAAYDPGHPWQYYHAGIEGSPYLHPKTHEELSRLLIMLRDEGEAATFTWLKGELRRRKRARDHYG